jgi:hypothetical protein
MFFKQTTPPLARLAGLQVLFVEAYGSACHLRVVLLLAELLVRSLRWRDSC